MAGKVHSDASILHYQGKTMQHSWQHAHMYQALHNNAVLLLLLMQGSWLSCSRRGSRKSQMPAMLIAYGGPTATALHLLAAERLAGCATYSDPQHTAAAQQPLTTGVGQQVRNAHHAQNQTGLGRLCSQQLQGR
jgi:hypothetical protein